MKARILLKTDSIRKWEGWSDSQIVEALETSATTVYRTRLRLVEVGIEPNRFCIGLLRAAEGTLARILRMLANKVVELDIVERASTIGGVFKKTPTQAAPQNAMGHPARSKRRLRSCHGGRAVRLDTSV
jgi:hypothetical protein